MTIWDLLTVAWRFRALTAVLMALTLAGTYAAAQPSTAYVGRVRVLLLAPEVYPGNALATTTQSLVAMAGVVAREVNGFSGEPQTVDSTVSLPSEGIVVGTSVRQINLGGQWDFLYEDPALDIQSTAPTLDEARTLLAGAVQEVEDALTTIQDTKSVPTALRIRTRLTPEEPVFTIQSGNRYRAIGASLGVGTLLSVLVLLVAEERTRRPGASRGAGRVHGRDDEQSPPGRSRRSRESGSSGRSTSRSDAGHNASLSRLVRTGDTNVTNR